MLRMGETLMPSAALLPETLPVPCTAGDRSAQRRAKARGDRRAPEVVKSAIRVLQVLEFFDRTRMPASVGAEYSYLYVINA